MREGGGGGGVTARNGQSDHVHVAAPLYTSGTSSGPGARKGAGQR